MAMCIFSLGDMGAKEKDLQAFHKSKHVDEHKKGSKEHLEPRSAVASFRMESHVQYCPAHHMIH